MKIIKNVNDLIALISLIFVIPGLWVTVGLGHLTLPGEVIGATIMAWGLILQYYFRRAPNEGSNN